MPGRPRTKNELRCFCARKPLLAVYGVDTRGKLYVHVKIYKQGQVYGEILITDGVVRMKCRMCFRWHKVVIRQPNVASLVESEEPAEVAGPPAALLADG